MDPEQLLMNEWPTVETYIATAARRRKLQEPETEELASVVKVKLFEHDCAVIRKFQHKSKLSTYLHTLIDRAALDICRRRAGRWHSSAAAKRLGPVAIEFERLIFHSGRSLEEAIEEIRRHRPEVGADELRAMMPQLPQRTPRDGRSVPLETVERTLYDNEEADVLIVTEERGRISERAAAIVRRLLAGFDDNDRLVFQMRFESNLSLADIARMLGLNPARLYRRHQELLGMLKKAMESDGITAREVADLIGHLSEESDFGLRETQLRPSE